MATRPRGDDQDEIRSSPQRHGAPDDPATAGPQARALGPLTRVVDRQQEEIEGLRRTRAADDVVTLAVGVLLERLQCSVTQARDQLTHLALQAGISPFDFALQVIESAGTTRPGDPPGPLGPAGSAGPTGPAQRSARLAEAAMATCTDGDDVAAALLREVLAPLGVSAVILWLVQPDGVFELTGAAGVRALDISRWQRLPPGVDSPARQVFGSATAAWWPDGHPRSLIGPPGARAALPLRDFRTAQVRGVMEVCWPSPLEAFAPALTRQVSAMADVAAAGLGAASGLAWNERALWLPALLDVVSETMLLTHVVRDLGGAVVDLEIDYVSQDFVDPLGRSRADLLGRRLLELYPLAGLPRGLFERLLEVHATGEPWHARHVTLPTIMGGAPTSVDLDVRAGPFFDGLAISWTVCDRSDQVAALLRHTERMGRLGTWHHNLVTGEDAWSEYTFTLFGLPASATPVPLGSLPDHVHPDDREAVQRFTEALLRLRTPAVGSFRLLRGDGAVRTIRAFGETVTDEEDQPILVRGAYQDMSEAYHTQAAFAVTRDQLVRSEQRADDQERLALRLQHAIVAASAPMPRSPDLEVTVRYRPAEEESLVGGDWFNAVRLPDGEVLLVVGDIAGHGISAVTGMVNLRYSLRGLAVTGAGPGQLLSWLNTVTYHLTDNITGTVVCGRYDPRSRLLRWARAGHLPPVLLRDGVARPFDLSDGPLLGVVPSASFEEVVIRLCPGDTLLMFSDGLIERRGVGLDEALDGLLRAAERPAGDIDIDQFADHLLASSLADTDDDTCLVVVRIRPEAAGSPASSK